MLHDHEIPLPKHGALCGDSGSLSQVSGTHEARSRVSEQLTSMGIVLSVVRCCPVHLFKAAVETDLRKGASRTISRR